MCINSSKRRRRRTRRRLQRKTLETSVNNKRRREENTGNGEVEQSHRMKRKGTVARHHPWPLVYYRVVCCVMKVSRQTRFSYGCAVVRSAQPRSAQSSPSSARARPNFSALSCNTKYVDITYHSFCRGSCCRFYLSERKREREHARARRTKTRTTPWRRAAPRRTAQIFVSPAS